PEFRNRMAGFVTARWNPEPTPYPSYDPAYYLALYVLQNNLAWKQMFVGGYSFPLTIAGNVSTAPIVTPDPTEARGYFASPEWQTRFQGNELEGYRLTTAYRLVNNVLGVQLTAAVNTT